MGDSTGQPSYGFHFLRLIQLVEKPRPLGDVARDSVDLTLPVARHPRRGALP